MSKVNICNSAIIYSAVQGKIDDFENDTTPVARTLRHLFDSSAESILSSFPWTFCQSYESPVKVSDIDIDGWKYTYEKPNNILLVNKVISNNRSVDYDTGHYNNKKVIFTKEDEITVKGNTYIRDVVLYPKYIQDLIALDLAIKLALEYSKEIKTIQLIQSKFDRMFEEAKKIDVKNSNIKGENSSNIYVESRG